MCCVLQFVSTLCKLLEKLKHQCPPELRSSGASYGNGDRYIDTLTAYDSIASALADQLEQPELPAFVDPEPDALGSAEAAGGTRAQLADDSAARVVAALRGGGGAPRGQTLGFWMHDL